MFGIKNYIMKINVFVVEKDNKIVQCDGIVNIYTNVQMDIPHPGRYVEWEAKDLTWTFWDITISIKEIEINEKDLLT